MYKKHYPLIVNEGSNHQKSNGRQQLRISTLSTFRIKELMMSKHSVVKHPLRITSEVKKNPNGSFLNKELEARFQQMGHYFEIFAEPSEVKEACSESFLKSQLYKGIKNKIKKFLVKVKSNIASACYKLLTSNQLDELEVKDFGAKNILLNVRSIYENTVMEIENHPNILLTLDFRLFREDLKTEIDDIVFNILIKTADQYPKTSIVGGNPRMKEVLFKIERVNYPQNDFIFLSKLEPKNLQKFNQRRNSIESFIMKTIHAAILVTGLHKQDPQGRTIFEKFKEFFEIFFLIVEQKEFQRKIDKYNIEKMMKQIYRKFYEILKKINTMKNRNEITEKTRKEIKLKFSLTKSNTLSCKTFFKIGSKQGLRSIFNKQNNIQLLHTSKKIS